MVTKIKYYLYSIKYKKIYTSTGIKNICNVNYVLLGRQNGKTIMSYKWNYVKAVERYDFKLAKMFKRAYKKVFHKNIF